MSAVNSYGIPYESESYRIWTRRSAGLILGLSIIGLLVRRALAAQSGLWRDEGLFMFVVRSATWTGMLDFLKFDESHPPLFYVVMKAWISIAGTTDGAAVALPIMLGVALIPAIYAVGASLFGPRTGMIAAVLATLSPALAEHSALARPYSFLPLMTLLSCYALIRGLDGGGWRIWLLHIVATLAVVYSHNWGLLILGGEWIAAVLVLVLRSRDGKPVYVRTWLVSQLCVVAAYAPWIPWLIHQSRNAGHAPLHLESHEWVSFLAVATFRIIQATLAGYFSADEGLGTASLLSALLAMALLFSATASMRPNVSTADTARRRGTGRPRDAIAMLLTVPLAACVAAIVFSPRSNLIFVRCIVALAPLVAIVLALWLGKSRTGTARMLATAAITLLAGSYGATVYELTQVSRSNARELAGVVARQTQSSDLLIIAPEWLASSFNLYYSPRIEQINFPVFRREGAVSHSGIRNRTADPVAFARIRADILRARAARRRVWLITDRDAVMNFSAGEIDSAARSRSYGFIGIVRANQIRAALGDTYGAADTSVAAATPFPRFENLRAYLYKPDASGTFQAIQ